MSEISKVSYSVTVRRAKSEYRNAKAQARAAYKIEKSKLRYDLHQSISPEHPKLSPKAKAETKALVRRAKQAYLDTKLEKKLEYKMIKAESKAHLRRQAKSVEPHPPASLSVSLAAAFVLVFMLIMLLQGGFVLYTVEYLSRQQCDRQLDTIYATLESADFSVTAAQNACRNDISFIVLDGKYQAGEVKNTKAAASAALGNRKITIGTEQYRLLVRQTEYGTIRIAKSLEAENNVFALLLVVMSVSIVLAAIASAVVGISISQRCLRPIHSISRMMTEISVSDLSARLDPDKIHTELRHLAGNYNDMMDRLEQSYKQQEQLISDASHELRTPLAVISGYADILERWGTEDPAVLQEAITSIGTNCAAMQELLERLLSLSRIQNGTFKIESKEQEIYPMIQELVGDFSIVAGRRTLKMDVPKSTLLDCDAAALRQVLVILLDNAVKFTEEGGSIRVFCEECKGETLVGVEDDGIGIPEEEQAKIFDRFYKADPARSQKGHGLGLSIAAGVCKAMNVRLAVTSKPGKFTKFTMVFPKK